MRPQFHFTAASGWINDPHGITYRDGQYDAFYQHVPGQTHWAPNCHWGHARGKDLLSLRELPIALAPGDGDGGIWTGSLISQNGTARIFYTSTTEPDIGMGRIRTAIPDDDGWENWTKGDVVADAPPELELTVFRDPFIRRDPDNWRMFVGGGDRRGTAMAVTYASTDLENWQYEGIALSRPSSDTEDVWMGALWECPQIFDIDDRSVMVSSVWDNDILHYVGYAVGTYEHGTFTATSWGRLTHGDSYYAPSYFTDSEGRPCLTFWMRGISDETAGWAGAHSVPYTLSLADEVLVATPHPDLEQYRQSSTSSHIPGLAADLSWTPTPRAISIESGDQNLVTLTAMTGSIDIALQGQNWRVPSTGTVRIILDGPVLEITTTGGMFAAAIAPAGESLTVHDPDKALMAYALSR